MIQGVEQFDPSSNESKFRIGREGRADVLNPVRVRNAIIVGERDDGSGRLPKSSIQRVGLSLSTFEQVMDARIAFTEGRDKSRRFILRIVVHNPNIPGEFGGTLGSKQSLKQVPQALAERLQVATTIDMSTART